MSHDGGGGHGGGHDGHGSGFHDNQGHHGGDHGHGGHATHEALVIAFAHDGNSHVSFSHGGAHSAHPHAFQAVHVGLGRQDAHSGLEGEDPIDINQVRTIVVHVTYHGKADVKGMLAALALKHDMIRIDTVRPNFDSVDAFKYELADWTAFTEPYAKLNMPEGFYPGAKGTTSIERTYWQIGQRPGFLKPLAFDRLAKTFLEISIVSWRYFETSDYETKFEIRVHSVPVWDELAGVYGYRRKPFQKHQSMARRLCQEMYDYLRCVEPSPSARILRARILAQYPADPVEDRPDGVLVGTVEDENDLNHGKMREIILTDGEARQNAGQNGPPAKAPTPTPPADNSGADDLIGLQAHQHIPSGADLAALLGHSSGAVKAVAVVAADTEVDEVPPPKREPVVIELED